MKEKNNSFKGKKIIITVICMIITAVLTFFVSKYILDISKKTNNSDTSSNEKISINSSKITSGGTYKITGSNDCIVINSSGDVELELEDATITCENGPAINIESAKEVSIDIKGENTLISTTTEDLDGAIYSKEDFELKGTGTLTIKSNYDGIVSKDSLVISGGTYNITSEDDGIRGKDSVDITGGTFNINAKGDGIKTTNEEDAEKGYINITGGTFTINSTYDGIQAITNLNIKDGVFNIKTTGDSSIDSAKGLKSDKIITIDGGTFDLNTTDDSIHSNGNVVINKGNITSRSSDDGVHGDGMVEINDGTLNISAGEGIEATYVKINGGNINITSNDDGINASNKTSDYSVKIEINGGNISINMSQGDTDGIDSNGDILITGGRISINGQSPFDYDGNASYLGGTIIVNGQTINEITNQFGGMMPGMQGRR